MGPMECICLFLAFGFFGLMLQSAKDALAWNVAASVAVAVSVGAWSIPGAILCCGLSALVAAFLAVRRRKMNRQQDTRKAPDAGASLDAARQGSSAQAASRGLDRQKSAPTTLVGVLFALLAGYCVLLFPLAVMAFFWNGWNNTVPRPEHKKTDLLWVGGFALIGVAYLAIYLRPQKKRPASEPQSPSAPVAEGGQPALSGIPAKPENGRTMPPGPAGKAWRMIFHVLCAAFLGLLAFFPNYACLGVSAARPFGLWELQPRWASLRAAIIEDAEGPNELHAWARQFAAESKRDDVGQYRLPGTMEKRYHGTGPHAPVPDGCPAPLLETAKGCNEAHIEVRESITIRYICPGGGRIFLHFSQEFWDNPPPPAVLYEEEIPVSVYGEGPERREMIPGFRMEYVVYVRG